MDAHEPITILLVDDNPSKLLTYEVILCELGEHLIKAGSAREALAHLLRTDIPIILIDVNMPELDGFALHSSSASTPLSADGDHLRLCRAPDAPRSTQGYEHGGTQRPRSFPALAGKSPCVRGAVPQDGGPPAGNGGAAASGTRSPARPAFCAARSSRGRVSHEIRNPLAALFLHVDVLEEELQQPTPESAAVTQALR